MKLHLALSLVFVLIFSDCCISQGLLNNANLSKTKKTEIEDTCTWCVDHENASFGLGEEKSFFNFLSIRIDSLKTKYKIENRKIFLIQFDVDKSGKVMNVDMIEKSGIEDLDNKIMNVL
jgi:hypothetical protein